MIRRDPVWASPRKPTGRIPSKAVTRKKFAPVQSGFCPLILEQFDMISRRPTRKPKVPKHLSADTRKWFANVIENFELEGHHLKLLTMAAEAWDRSRQAREALDEHGLTYSDRFGCPHPRPEIAIERDARTGFARILRELDLDIEPPAEQRRPPGIRSNRGGR
jgi:P27 family predicted phage terminase small subunit